MSHKIALIGFGGMAGWHYDKIQEIDGLEVAGIWDIKEERRTYAQAKNIHIMAWKICLQMNRRI